MIGRALLLFSFTTMFLFNAGAQKNDKVVHEQCGTMEHLQLQFETNPLLKQKFEQQREDFNKALRAGNLQADRRANDNDRINGDGYRTAYNIPVVFHIVLANPNSITNAQIQAQLDTLNKDFAGTNGDSVKIPFYFKPLFGKSGIQFCLAQRTPNGQNTTGIDRVVTSQSSFRADDAVKHSASGGVDAWDPNSYLNVWICQLGNNLLGYATFPDEGLADDQGVVIDYRTVPGGSSVNYGQGKSLTHETGHYFNLYHIWGDDNGDCTGTDFVDDTPNQGASSSGCYAGVKTDSCTTTTPGIMYQNYMDYSFDACMVMFTTEQVLRMESAAVAYRSSLLRSNACKPPLNFDVVLQSITQPSQRICAGSFTPVITFKNSGLQTLTSLTITTKIDNGPLTTNTWTGSLAKAASATISLSSQSTQPGNHLLSVYVSKPNNNADEDPSTDTLSIAFQYYLPVTKVSESFEDAAFPPVGWDVVNPDNSITWKRVTGIAKTGNASVMMDNFHYSTLKQKDDLRLPEVTLRGVDSAFLSFNVAAAVATSFIAINNNWDTLEVLLSTDCGQSYVTLYKKFADNLATRLTPTTSTFIPTASEWRKDSINLTGFIGASDVLLAFRNTNGNENSVYLDDINVRTVTINPNLKSQGILITPNPTRGVVAVQFYPLPATLKGIEIYNISGQKVAEVLVSGAAANLYNLNISNQPAGTYVVRVLFSDRVVTRKVLKL